MPGELAEDPVGVPTCSLGTIPAGGFAQYTVDVTVNSPAAAGLDDITNAVTVTSDSTDPTSGNDSTTEDTAIGAEPDMSIDKDDAGVVPLPGNTIVYTLTYDNVGDQDATGVTMASEGVTPAQAAFAL